MSFDTRSMRERAYVVHMATSGTDTHSRGRSRRSMFEDKGNARPTNEDSKPAETEEKPTSSNDPSGALDHWRG